MGSLSFLLYKTGIIIPRCLSRERSEKNRASQGPLGLLSQPDLLNFQTRGSRDAMGAGTCAGLLGGGAPAGEASAQAQCCRLPVPLCTCGGIGREMAPAVSYAQQGPSRDTTLLRLLQEGQAVSSPRATGTVQMAVPKLSAPRGVCLLSLPEQGSVLGALRRPSPPTFQTPGLKPLWLPELTELSPSISPQ